MDRGEKCGFAFTLPKIRRNSKFGPKAGITRRVIPESLLYGSSPYQPASVNSGRTNSLTVFKSCSYSTGFVRQEIAPSFLAFSFVASWPDMIITGILENGPERVRFRNC